MKCKSLLLTVLLGWGSHSHGQQIDNEFPLRPTRPSRLVVSPTLPSERSVSDMILPKPLENPLTEKITEDIRSGSCDNLGVDSCRVKLGHALEKVSLDQLIQNPNINDEWNDKLSRNLQLTTEEDRVDFLKLKVQTQKTIVQNSQIIVAHSGSDDIDAQLPWNRDDDDLLKKNAFTIQEMIAVIDIGLAVEDDAFLDEMLPLLAKINPEIRDAIECLRQNKSHNPAEMANDLKVSDVLGGKINHPFAEDLKGPISGSIIVKKGFSQDFNQAGVDKDGYTPGQRLMGGLLGAINLNIKTDTPYSYGEKVSKGVMFVVGISKANPAIAVAIGALGVEAGLVVGVVDPARYGIEPKSPPAQQQPKPDPNQNLQAEHPNPNPQVEQPKPPKEITPQQPEPPKNSNEDESNTQGSHYVHSNNDLPCNQICQDRLRDQMLKSFGEARRSSNVDITIPEAPNEDQLKEYEKQLIYVQVAPGTELIPKAQVEEAFASKVNKCQTYHSK